MSAVHAGFLETVRLDAETKIRLTTLKKRTGITNWNVASRWAFCLSLSDETPVRERQEHEVGAVEMTWKTFAGDEDEVFRALLVQRCQKEHGKIDKETQGRTLRQHISRGAGWLVAADRVKSLTDLVELVTQKTKKR